MKRVIPVFLILLLLIPLIPQKTEAAAAPVIRVAASSGGARILAAVAEKGGIKYATKTAREKAVQRWNLDLHKKIQYYDEVGDQYKKEELERFTRLLENADTEIKPMVSKPGFGRVIVSTAAFATGLDLLYEGYQSLKMAKEQEKMFERLADHTQAVESGERLVAVDNVSFWVGNDKDGDYGILVGSSNPMVNPDKTTNYKGLIYAPIPDEWYGWITKVTSYSTYKSFDYTFEYWKPNYTDPIRRTGSVAVAKIAIQEGAPKIISSPVGDLEIPQITELPWIQPFIETGAVPEELPDNIAIEVPLTNDYPENVSDPWNEPIRDPAAEPDPLAEPSPEPEPGTEEPPPGDGGTGEEPPPTKEPGKNPFKDAIPVALLLALFDLLVSIIFYLLRMLEFILKIPTIPQKPFGNEAFEWFKTTKIMGVYIYSVVMSMGTIGLSFLVYKAIRRVMP